jgi:hypothetical protein
LGRRGIEIERENIGEVRKKYRDFEVDNENWCKNIDRMGCTRYEIE